MKLITKLYLSFGLILLIFSIVTLSYIRQSAKVEEEIQQVLLSTELLRTSESAQKNLVDMETGIRGFLLTENEPFLEPYYNGKKKGAENFKRLGVLIDDTTEKRLLKEIAVLGQVWVSEFSEKVIQAKKQAIADPSEAYQFDSVYRHAIKAGQGKKIMDNIRLKFSEFDQYNIQIKNNQLSALNSSIQYTKYISIGLTIMAIILGLLIAFLLGRTISRRLNELIDMAGHIAQGDFEIEVADKENDEMSRLATSLNLMAVKLKTYFNNLTKSNKELDQFAYVVSHDLKAPLRAINNLAEWIAEDLPEADPDIKKNLELMRGRAQRMENLINGILEYSKVGRKEIKPETFDVKKLLEDIIDSLAPAGNFRIELPDKMPVLTTEKILLQQVFTNLISNGIKYNDKPEGSIKITSEEAAGNFYTFSVTDFGPGIPEQFHDRVFGIFQTMEARDTRESTGIGLAIVKKIIEEKGGKIWIASEEGKFTKFSFTWPAKNTAITKNI